MKAKLKGSKDRIYEYFIQASPDGKPSGAVTLVGENHSFNITQKEFDSNFEKINEPTKEKE